MKYGVNYTPSAGWFYTWLHPDWGRIREDLEQIASIRVDHVRIFPLWPILQPNRNYINPQALDDLRHMGELAAEAGLDCYVDVLQGHLSSFDFLPSWLRSWHSRNMFVDAEAVQAQSQLVMAIYDAMADVQGFAGLTLGNECNQFASMTHPSPMPLTKAQADAWLRALLLPLQERAHHDGRVLLHSENDEVWYADGHPFTPGQAANLGDVTAIHSWVFNGTAQHYGALSVESVGHAEYLVELSKAFARHDHRPVWVQEIGAPNNVITNSESGVFCSRSIQRMLRCSDLYGITWWCSHDVDGRFVDFPELEHHLGLFDLKGNLTEVGKAFSQIVAEPLPMVVDRQVAVIVDVDEQGLPLSRGSLAPGGSVFEAWMQLSRSGEHPAVVTSACVHDEQSLNARGIRECLPVELRTGNVYSNVARSD